MAFCTNCGNRMDGNVRFCGACGTRTELPAAQLRTSSAPVASVISAATQVAVASTAPPPVASAAGNDLLLKGIAGASILVSVAGCVAGLLGIIPSGVGTIVVMIAASVGMRVTWLFAAKSASSAARARITQMVSNVGLAVSAVALIACLPRITQLAGIATFFEDASAQLWTMALLVALALPVRTMGWRVFVGAALTGFLGITALARFLGRPMIESLGMTND